MPAWSEIAESEDYLALPENKKAVEQLKFYHQYIKPDLEAQGQDKVAIEATKKQFFEYANPKPETSPIGDMLGSIPATDKIGAAIPEVRAAVGGLVKGVTAGAVSPFQEEQAATKPVSTTLPLIGKVTVDEEGVGEMAGNFVALLGIAGTAGASAARGAFVTATKYSYPVIPRAAAYISRFAGGATTMGLLQAAKEVVNAVQTGEARIGARAWETMKQTGYGGLWSLPGGLPQLPSSTVQRMIGSKAPEAVRALVSKTPSLVGSAAVGALTAKMEGKDRQGMIQNAVLFMALEALGTKGIDDVRAKQAYDMMTGVVNKQLVDLGYPAGQARADAKTWLNGYIKNAATAQKMPLDQLLSNGVARREFMEGLNADFQKTFAQSGKPGLPATVNVPQPGTQSMVQFPTAGMPINNAGVSVRQPIESTMPILAAGQAAGSAPATPQPPIAGPHRTPPSPVLSEAQVMKQVTVLGKVPLLTQDPNRPVYDKLVTDGMLMRTGDAYELNDKMSLEQSAANMDYKMSTKPMKEWTNAPAVKHVQDEVGRMLRDCTYIQEGSRFVTQGEHTATEEVVAGKQSWLLPDWYNKIEGTAKELEESLIRIRDGKDVGRYPGAARDRKMKWLVMNRLKTGAYKTDSEDIFAQLRTMDFGMADPTKMPGGALQEGAGRLMGTAPVQPPPGFESLPDQESFIANIDKLAGELVARSEQSQQGVVYKDDAEAGFTVVPTPDEVKLAFKEGGMTAVRKLQEMKNQGLTKIWEATKNTMQNVWNESTIEIKGLPGLSQRIRTTVDTAPAYFTDKATRTFVGMKSKMPMAMAKEANDYINALSELSVRQAGFDVVAGATVDELKADIARMEAKLTPQQKELASAMMEFENGLAAEGLARGILNPDDIFPGVYTHRQVLEKGVKRTAELPGSIARFKPGYTKAKFGTEKPWDMTLDGRITHWAQRMLDVEIGSFAQQVANDYDKWPRLQEKTKPVDMVRTFGPSGQPTAGATYSTIPGLEGKYRGFRLVPKDIELRDANIKNEVLQEAVKNNWPQEKIDQEIAKRIPLRRTYLIPEAVYGALMGKSKQIDSELVKLAIDVHGIWKRVALDTAFMGFQVQNALGDLVSDMIVAPGMIRMAVPAAQMAAEYYFGIKANVDPKMRALAERTLRHGAVDSGFTPEMIQEGSRGGGGLAKKGVEAYESIASAREATFRIAMGMHQLDLVERGLDVEPGVVKIEGLTPEQAALKIMNNAATDYKLYRYLRYFITPMFPFMPWGLDNVKKGLVHVARSGSLQEWTPNPGTVNPEVFAGEGKEHEEAQRGAGRKKPRIPIGSWVSVLSSLGVFSYFWNNSDNDRKEAYRKLPEAYKKATIISTKRGADGKLESALIQSFQAGPDMFGSTTGMDQLLPFITEKVAMKTNPREAAKEFLIRYVVENPTEKQIKKMEGPMAKIIHASISGKDPVSGRPLVPKGLENPQIPAALKEAERYKWGYYMSQLLPPMRYILQEDYGKKEGGTWGRLKGAGGALNVPGWFGIREVDLRAETLKKKNSAVGDIGTTVRNYEGLMRSIIAQHPETEAKAQIRDLVRQAKNDGDGLLLDMGKAMRFYNSKEGRVARKEYELQQMGGDAPERPGKEKSLLNLQKRRTLEKIMKLPTRQRIAALKAYKATGQYLEVDE